MSLAIYVGIAVIVVVAIVGVIGIVIDKNYDELQGKKKKH